LLDQRQHRAGIDRTAEQESLELVMRATPFARGSKEWNTSPICLSGFDAFAANPRSAWNMTLSTACATLKVCAEKAIDRLRRLVICWRSVSL
jgi:hypothetical protein